jgi:hypothetical protein
MKKTTIAAALVALLFVGSGYGLHDAAGSPQHRKPAETAQAPGAPKEARPAPPSTPKGGHTAPPDAPKTGQAVPRPPDARREPPDHPRRGPQGPERVVIPYPGWPWWGYPYPYDYPPQGPWRVFADWEVANVRIAVTPNDAQVYVDHYLAGVVDDFDGLFQHLTLRAGVHLIEIRKTGYTTLVVELNLQPGQTVTYRRTMEPSRGEIDAPSALPVAPGFEEGAVPPSMNAVPGDVRLEVTPKDAAVYADGFYAGIASDFDGSQHLLLAPGRHHLALKLEGYESIEVDLSIDSAQTITYSGTLKRAN